MVTVDTNKNPRKILICGDREWNDVDTMAAYMQTIDINTIIIHGAARGADAIAGVIASELGMPVKSYPADWVRYKRAAGPIRNRQMYDTELPDLVVAFHNDLVNSKGTKDMIEYAKSKGTPTMCIRTGDF